MENFHCVFYVLIFLTYTSQHAGSYKHIIFMHGIMSDPSEFKDFHNYLQKDHPGTNVTVIDAFNDYDSLINMWTQTQQVMETVQQVMDENPKGVHFLCFSQGGLLCRALIESAPRHNVDTFISLSAPQGGQYGDTDVLHLLFPWYVKHNLYRLFYTEYGQKLSVANYWNDPHEQELFLEYSDFLPVLNNQVQNNRSKQFRSNFSKLKHLVLIGGPDDGVIAPWQSSQFGSFNESGSVIEMKDQLWYINDSFGLRSLDKRGAVHTYTVPGVEHIHWHTNYTVWKCCIEKWLT